nr:hypothetical protein [Streptomyces thermoviolaceus]
MGEDWQITHNYFKRHASCSYTHPAADLALDLRTARHLDRLRPAEVTDAVREIRVDTHALAAPLDRRRWDGSLGAMFSVPYAVAAALLDGAVTPATAEATEAERPELFALAAKVSVAEDPALTARLPHERATRLTAVLAGGERVELSAPHPVGDSSHHPFTTRTLQAVLTGLLGDDTLTDQLRRAADRLPDTDGAGPLLRGLAALTAAPAASRGGTR